MEEEVPRPLPSESEEVDLPRLQHGDAVEGQNAAPDEVQEQQVKITG